MRAHCYCSRGYCARHLGIVPGYPCKRMRKRLTLRRWLRLKYLKGKRFDRDYWQERQW